MHGAVQKAQKAVHLWGAWTAERQLGAGARELLGSLEHKNSIAQQETGNSEGRVFGGNWSNYIRNEVL